MVQMTVLEATAGSMSAQGSNLPKGCPKLRCKRSKESPILGSMGTLHGQMRVITGLRGVLGPNKGLHKGQHRVRGPNIPQNSQIEGPEGSGQRVSQGSGGQKMLQMAVLGLKGGQNLLKPLKSQKGVQNSDAKEAKKVRFWVPWGHFEVLRVQ